MTPAPDPRPSIAYSNGQWGPAATLAVPLDDRGLLLADGLFETLLLAAGKPVLLEAHLERWRVSAALLGMPAPPGAGEVAALIQEASARSGIGDGALRLNWSRGSSGRGLDLPEPEQAQGRFWLQLSATEPRFEAITAVISASERRLAGSVLSRCKTFSYGSAIQARREAHQRGADEALLRSSDGSLCCGTSANLLVERHGRWRSPPLASGCLPGILRGRALELGLAEEADLRLETLQRWWQEDDGACLLINSLSCRPLRSLDEYPLTLRDGEALWRRLIQED